MQFGKRRFFRMKQNAKISVLSSAKNVTLLAMMTALSVIIGIFCKNFLSFGSGLFRVTFENLPIILSGILFGPIAGGLVGVSSDLISYLLSSQIYPPNLIITAGACAVGIVSGLVPRLIVKKKGTLQIAVSGVLAHIVGSMIIKPIGLYQFYGILVLWRIPLYLLIAPIEIFILCTMLKRPSFCKLTGYL